jgi:hypothetical protein
MAVPSHSQAPWPRVSVVSPTLNEACNLPHVLGALPPDIADFARGTRFAEGGGSEDITRRRALGNRMLTGLVNLLCGARGPRPERYLVIRHAELPRAVVIPVRLCGLANLWHP